MRPNRFFWPQEVLDQWLVDEKIVIDGQELKILAENLAYQLDQAVYFVRDVGDGSDPHQLVGRVKDLVAIEEMGAEHYMDSVLIGDTAYEVVTGFAGVPATVDRAVGDIQGAIASQTGDDSEAEDKELLARFLIENL